MKSMLKSALRWLAISIGSTYDPAGAAKLAAQLKPSAR